MLSRAGVAIDLGTVNTLVWVDGRGLVLEEPSAIAIDDTTGSVVATGTSADALADKEPRDIRVIHPLRDGVIADLDATAEMLHGFLRKSGALEPVVSAIGVTVQNVLSDIPAGLAEDVVRGQVRLSGGGALLPGLADRIAELAGIGVVGGRGPAPLRRPRRGGDARRGRRRSRSARRSWPVSAGR
jgi:actin-like ATPase involved in cell morphogenesis